MSRRNLSLHKGHESTNFESVDSFLNSVVPAGIITIDYNGSPLDILNQPAMSKTTVVMFHTALSPRMLTLPVFSGGGVTTGLGVNLIFVSDPTLELDDELKLAWFAGNARQPLQRDLPGILRHVLLSQESEHVIFFGASGGGFAALFYSAFFPGSLALPMNPQVIIKNYSEDQACQYARVAFGAADFAQTKAVLADRISGDLRHIYRGGHSNTVGYIQNVGDTHHVHRHMAHLLADMPRSDRMFALAGDWGKGHVPPSKEFVSQLLGAVGRCDGQWPEALLGLGFTQAPEPDHALRAAYPLPG